jgi:CTP synthase (UTP-ammonia lyase)
LTHPQIAVSGVDQDGEIRIVEMPGHTFFLITLFVPQIRSMPESPHPLIRGFVKAVCAK